MKIIFTVAHVKNENDIIESFCRYNLTYCDGMLIKDNGSTDNTKEIIEKLIIEGLPIYYVNTADKLEMSQIAINEYEADLIVPLDADEFLYHAEGINPRELLESLLEDVEYQIPWRTYIYQKEPDIKLGFMPNNFSHYRNPILEDAQGHAGKALISKYLMQEKQPKFTSGAHWLLYPDVHQGSVTIERHKKLVCAHFPVRSKLQIMKKVIPNSIIHMKLFKNTIPFEQHYSNHQLGILFKELKDNGDICNEKMAQNSIEYSLYNLGNKEIIAKLMLELGDKLSLHGSMNTVFCSDKLSLRYTYYNENNKAFISDTLKNIDETVMFLSSEIAEISRTLQEIILHNKALSLQILKRIPLFVRNAESENKKIIIWGAGQGGVNAFELLEHYDVKIHAFLDRSPGKIGTFLKGLPVLSPETLNTDQLWHHSHCAVFIASMAHVQIAEQLEASGWREGSDYFTIPLNILNQYFKAHFDLTG